MIEKSCPKCNPDLLKSLFEGNEMTFSIGCKTNPEHITKIKFQISNPRIVETDVQEFAYEPISQGLQGKQ